MRTSRPGPFSVGVRDLVHHPGRTRSASFPVVIDARWGEGLVAVPTGATVSVDVRLEAIHEGILATGSASSRYEGECGRCLEPVAAPVEVEFQELFAYPGTAEGDFEVQDDRVDLEALVRDTIVVTLPFQPVCRPDCPGLDPVSGERRADGAGPAEAPVDPRWAALAPMASETARPAAE